MSSFFGVFSPGGNLDQVAFDQMKSAIHRDGYDELETHLNEHIGMGHLMLRVTPESAYDKQPLKSDCGRYTLVGHFRLDYRDELGDKLGLTQVELELAPDSLLVMKAYRKWEEKCVHHLEGDWAFAVYDNIEETVFFAKDPTGISSLFYLIHDNSIYFSTDPTVFSKCDFFSLDLDITQFAYYSVNGLKIDKGFTLLKNVKIIPNGFTARINLSLEAQLSQFYDLSFCHQQKKYRYEFDVAYHFKSIYFNALKSRCRSVSEIGLFLSSGLDSMSVAALSSNELKKLGNNLYTFTSVPSSNSKLTEKEKQFADESSLVQIFNRDKGNVRSYFLSFNDFKLSEIDWEDLRLNPFNPSFTMNSFWIHGILKEAKRNNIRLMLTGQMGNFTLSADGYLVHIEMFFRLQFFKLYHELKHYARINRITFIQAFRTRVLSVVKFNLKYWLKKRSLFSYHFFSGEGNLSLGYYKKNKNIFESKRTDLIPGYSSFFFSRNLRVSQLQKHLYYSNMYWAMYGESVGISLTDPTSDSRVIEFSLSISDTYFNKFGISKYLYKLMFSYLLPKEILENTISKIQSFDFGDRIKGDTSFVEMLRRQYAQVSHLYQLNDSLPLASIENISKAKYPNYKRSDIAKLLNHISIINYLTNFK